MTDIVKAFIDRGNPGYAFATVCVFGIPIAAGASVVALKLLH